MDVKGFGQGIRAVTADMVPSFRQRGSPVNAEFMAYITLSRV